MPRNSTSCLWSARVPASRWPVLPVAVGSRFDWHDRRMSVSAAQADAFYREVLSGQLVSTVFDTGGYPAPYGSSGSRAMPFWSRRSRAQRIIDNVVAYAGFEVEEMPLERWREEWLPDLDRDGLLVGVNWSGRRATGYDLPPADVLRNLRARTSTST
jgi:hypothetical protein